MVRIGLFIALVLFWFLSHQAYGEASTSTNKKPDEQTKQLVAIINSSKSEQEIVKKIIDFYVEHLTSKSSSKEKEEALKIVTLSAYEKFDGDFISKVAEELSSKVSAADLAKVLNFLSHDKADRSLEYDACLFWLEKGENAIALAAYPEIFDANKKLPPLKSKAEIGYYSCPFQHAMNLHEYNKAQILLSKIREAVDWGAADAQSKIYFYYRSATFHRQIGEHAKSISDFEKAIDQLDPSQKNSSQYSYLTTGLISAHLANKDVATAEKLLQQLSSSMKNGEPDELLVWNSHLLNATAAFLGKNKVQARRHLTFLYNVANKMLSKSTLSSNYLNDLINASLISHFFGFSQYGSYFSKVASSVKGEIEKSSSFGQMSQLLEIYSNKPKNWRVQYESHLNRLEKVMGKNSPEVIYFRAAM